MSKTPISKMETPTPEEYINKVKYDEEGQMIFAVNEKKEMQLLLNVRGWGNIQHLFKSQSDAIKFQDEIGQWIADAINQKLTQQKGDKKEFIKYLENQRSIAIDLKAPSGECELLYDVIEKAKTKL